jgi:hypothetical protein
MTRSPKTVEKVRIPARARRELRWYFARNGYVRLQDPKRLARDGYMGYKKGDEVRLSVNDARELRDLRTLLVEAGFNPGSPYAKGRQLRQPIYGREAVRRFLQLLGVPENLEPDADAAPSRRVRPSTTQTSSAPRARRRPPAAR